LTSVKTLGYSTQVSKKFVKTKVIGIFQINISIIVSVRDLFPISWQIDSVDCIQLII